MRGCKRGILLERHFDKAVRVCPMAGKRAPDLANGKIFEVLGECWQDIETDIMSVATEMHPLTAEQLEYLKSEMTRAKTTMATLLHTKCDYWNRLPWMMAALAHHCEEVARACGRRSLAAFEWDPRAPPVHHQKTWELLRPESLFRVELESFIAGTPRWECSEIFTMQISIFRFLPVVETTIEEKHARVSLEEKRHHIGPARVSLANRLPFLGRCLLREPEMITDFLDDFDAARKLSSVPAKLNLEGHPLITPWATMKNAPHPWHRAGVLTQVFYHCDMAST
jgi:hypothetical protein